MTTRSEIVVTLPPAMVTDYTDDQVIAGLRAFAKDLQAEPVVGQAIESVAFGLANPQLRTARERDFDLWYVQVVVARPEGQWTSIRTLPTFLIDGAIQGCEHFTDVTQIVADMLMVDLHRDWQFMAVVRQGGTNDVNSINLHTGATYPGDRVSGITDF